VGLQRATLTNVSRSPREAPVEVQFNPTEYGIDNGAAYAELQVPGLAMPLLQFVRGEARVLSLELFLDGTDKRASTRPDDSVAGQLEKIRRFVQIDSDLHAPPVCLFEWRDVRFQGVVTSLKEKYTLFAETGKILRARVTLSLKSYEAVEVQLRELKLQSPDRTRVRVVREGDTLASIASEAYGDPRLWRHLAEENGIDRPRFLRPGTPLRIPSL
jgi:contractile injection system tube protein/LysM domain-containing protein